MQDVGLGQLSFFIDVHILHLSRQWLPVALETIVGCQLAAATGAGEFDAAKHRGNTVLGIMQ